MHYLIWIALALAVIWVVARLIAGIAGVLLNLLWIVAIIVFVVWLIGKIRGGRSSST
jgi:ABC-type polysaccharide/polyol phosphate export permease